jgi:hypothetical protein
MHVSNEHLDLWNWCTTANLVNAPCSKPEQTVTTTIMSLTGLFSDLRCLFVVLLRRLRHPSLLLAAGL